MARNNRIVLVANSSWYIYNFRLQLVRALLRTGWQVTVVAPPDGYTRRIVQAGASYRALVMQPKGLSPAQEALTLLRFVALYRELSPAVALHFTIKPNVYGSLASRLLGVAAINTVTGLGAMFSGGLRERLVSALCRLAFSHAQFTYFQNDDDRALFLRRRVSRPERTGVLPGSGVDPDRFAPRPRGEGPFCFLMAARLLREKGVEDFVAAARILKSQHRQVRFILLGGHDAADPECADATILEEAEKDGVIERLGHVEDVRPTVAAADCVVLPSYYREGVPRSLLEAASMGKPLIAADCPGTREPVLDGENGFLCRPRDPEDLAAKMERMIAMAPEQLSAMGAASRSYMQRRFDERFVIGSYLDAVEAVAGRPVSPK